jgi:hypothetical protein
MKLVGYRYLIERLNLHVLPVPLLELEDEITLEDTVVGHLEFALQYEGINLEVIDAVFEHLQPSELIDRLKKNPNGEYIRRLCFLWEWLGYDELNAGISSTGKYIDLFPRQKYLTTSRASQNHTYRINNNALGTASFCPIVKRNALATDSPTLDELLEQAHIMLEESSSEAIYDRAISYLYLSETRSSFAIEKETPSAKKEERFIRLLHRVWEYPKLTEDALVELQNVAVRDVYSQEASYRTRQNWLENSLGRITYFPPPPEQIRELMTGWENFINDTNRGTDLLVVAACATFGFVYLHPFMDGNGRLHRFIIHQVLSRHSNLPKEFIIPVSAVIMKNIAAYLEVLTNFSEAVTKLWDYRRIDIEPNILKNANARTYRFFNADKEVRFLQKMLQQAIEVEMPKEVAWLNGYDKAFMELEGLFDLPKKDISALIRMIYHNGGKLSKHRRKQYIHLPKLLLDQIETVVNKAFS